MVLVNYATKEIVAKIVYYGPGLCGKTTNLQQIFTRLNARKRGKMISLATEADRTLFFDFLPLELGVVQGFKVRFQLYTVPGQVFYSATRKLVLKGADAVIFVADSQSAVLGKNIESFEDMRLNLMENNLDPSTIPMVIQYNKRDLPNVLDVATIDAKLNIRHAPWFEAVATEGTGVVETFKEVTRLLIRDLKKKHAMMETGVVEELPPGVFEESPPPPAEERPAEREFVIERIHDHREEPEEAAAQPVAIPAEMETISLTDTAQAEAFLDDVRKGAPAEEAKLKAEMLGGRGDGIFERELTPDELDASEMQGDEEEVFEPDAGTLLDNLPDMDFESDIESETAAEPETAKGSERGVPSVIGTENETDLDELRFRQTFSESAAMDQMHRLTAPTDLVGPENKADAAPEPMPEPIPEPISKAVAETEPETETEPVAETEPETETESWTEAESWAETESGASRDTLAETDTFRATFNEMELLAGKAKLTTPSELVGPDSQPAQMPEQAPGTAPADTAELLDTLLRLEGEVISLKFEVAKLAAGAGAGPEPSGASQSGLDALGKALSERAEGQDRLLLSILEAVRESKRANAEALERVESAIKQLTGRSGDETKITRKKWF